MMTIECKLSGKKADFLKIEEAIQITKFIQNKCLALWEESKGEKAFGKHTGNYYLPQLKKEFPFVAKLNAQACQATAERTWQQIAAFFKRCKQGIKPVGYPKYRKKGKSFELKQSGWKLSDKGRLTIFKIGSFKLYGIRDLLGQLDKIQRLHIIKRADGYYCQFVIKVNREEVLPPTGKTVGLDLGLTYFYVDSENNKIISPKFYKNAKEKISRLSRQHARKEKGSKNREKARIRLAKAHLKVQRQRKDFVTKLAKYVVRNNDLVAIEDLNVTKMAQKLERYASIMDAGWYSFRQWLIYYSKIYGRVVQVVDPAYTSQDCSGCGFRVKKTLKERIHTCTECGLVLDRDHNAAINILQRGLKQLSTAGQAGINASGEATSTSGPERELGHVGSLKEESYSSLRRD